MQSLRYFLQRNLLVLIVDAKSYRNAETFTREVARHLPQKIGAINLNDTAHNLDSYPFDALL